MALTLFTGLPKEDDIIPDTFDDTRKSETAIERFMRAKKVR
jgi:hypothetical protein